MQWGNTIFNFFVGLSFFICEKCKKYPNWKQCPFDTTLPMKSTNVDQVNINIQVMLSGFKRQASVCLIVNTTSCTLSVIKSCDLYHADI